MTNTNHFPAKPKVGMISLGCAKNLVDAEIMLGSVLQRGMEITSRAEEADVLVINTCAFIDSAKEESIEAILEAHQQRGLNKRPDQKLIVSGCMSQRFARELHNELPEVDAFIGLDQIRELGAIVEKIVTRPSRLRHTSDASEMHALRSLIKRNIEIKSKIVAKDERDQSGNRAILNFGHTVGHAIERAGDYRKFLHGEALSLGIVAACAISTKRAGLPPGQRDAIVSLLQRFELPTCLPKNFPRNKIISAVKFDKKFERGKIRFVVTPGVGSAHVSHEVTIGDIREAVSQL
jgi:hypothetical protein